MSKHIFYTFFMFIFSMVSYLIMTISIVISKSTVWLLLPLVYAFPKTIEAVSNIQNITYNRMETVLNIIVAVCGALVIIITLVALSFSSNINDVDFLLKVGMIFLSCFFVLSELYELVHELIKYVNVRNQLKLNESEDSI